ncbi:MAG: hypothetical protein JWM04_1233 [Verrucomicrobiales bacterium]|nr:hypothetical protein [Verrucomicrobiales bacterium]
MWLFVSAGRFLFAGSQILLTSYPTIFFDAVWWGFLVRIVVGRFWLLEVLARGPFDD